MDLRKSNSSLSMTVSPLNLLISQATNLIYVVLVRAGFRVRSVGVKLGEKQFAMYAIPMLYLGYDKILRI